MHSRGVAKSVGESNGQAGLVCRIPVCVGHRHLQGDVLLGRCDDGDAPLPMDTMLQRSVFFYFDLLIDAALLNANSIAN